MKKSKKNDKNQERLEEAVYKFKLWFVNFIIKRIPKKMFILQKIYDISFLPYSVLSFPPPSKKVDFLTFGGNDKGEYDILIFHISV